MGKIRKFTSRRKLFRRRDAEDLRMIDALEYYLDNLGDVSKEDCAQKFNVPLFDFEKYVQMHENSEGPVPECTLLRLDHLLISDLRKFCLGNPLCSQKHMKLFLKAMTGKLYGKTALNLILKKTGLVRGFIDPFAHYPEAWRERKRNFTISNPDDEMYF